jgi:transposase
MNPVIGLDVAKGESQVQVYLEKKKPYKKSVKVQHKVLVQKLQDKCN